jgi:hypothetical protein
MDIRISSKLVSLFFGIFVVLFLVGFYAFGAWTNPDDAPPDSSIGVPIMSNSSEAQIIGNSLIVNGAFQSVNIALFNRGAKINTTAALPTCDESMRGTIWFVEGSTDSLLVCMNYSGVFVWRKISTGTYYGY